MTKITFRNKKLIDTLSSSAKIQNRSMAGFTLGLVHTKNQYVNTIKSGVRTGKPYRIRYKGRLLTGRHSTPFEDIGNVTGETARLSYATLNRVEGAIGSKAPYSGYMEFGGGSNSSQAKSSKIIPRRTAKKVVDKNLSFMSLKIKDFILK